MSSKKANDLNLANISKRISSLPMLPSVVCELMSAKPGDDDFFQKIADIAKFEPSLSARVLRIVNSISASPVSPITDINQALIRAGSDEVLSCITMLSVARVFTPVNDEQKSLWQHSIETAHFAHYLAQSNSALNIEPSMAYISGLLHDLGRFVLFNLSSKSIDFIAAKDWETPAELTEVEMQYLGFTHTQVGYLAAIRWQLPKLISKVIKHHHNYNQLKGLGLSGDTKKLVYVVQLADYLSMYFMNNADWKDLDEAALVESLFTERVLHMMDEIGVDPKKLIAAAPEVLSQSFEGMKKLRIA
jgi:putative nucleotidyltransferase with HDIG domain